MKEVTLMSTGHLRRRTSKTGKVSYQVIIEYEADPITGKRQRSYKTASTKKEAEAILERMKNEASNDGIFKPSTLRLADWLHEWLGLYLPNIEETTRAGYKERIENKIIPYLGNIPLKHLKTSEIQYWINSLTKDEGLAPKSVKNIFLNLKASLDKAVTLHMIATNPCTGVELPKLKKYKAEVYDETEIQQLMNAVKGTDMYLFVVLEIFLGLRRGELAALKWEDVDLDNGIVHITKNKVIADGKKITKAPKSQAGTRDIAMGDKLTAILKKEKLKYLEDKLKYGAEFIDSGNVIRQPKGNEFSPDSLTQKWIRFRKAKGLKEIRLHDLRHTCATAMLNADVNIKVIQSRLGHSDISTTMNIYAHALPSMNKDAGEKIDSMILGNNQLIG